MARLGLHDTCCQANWQVYQASAGTGNKQHCLLLSKPLVLCLISLLFAKSIKPTAVYLNFPMSALPKLAIEIAESQKPSSKSPLVNYCTASLSSEIIDHMLVSVYVWLQPEINSLLHPCLCNNRLYVPHPRPLSLVCINLLLYAQGCNNLYIPN